MAYEKKTWQEDAAILGEMKKEPTKKPSESSTLGGSVTNGETTVNGHTEPETANANNARGEIETAHLEGTTV